MRPDLSKRLPSNHFDYLNEYATDYQRNALTSGDDHKQQKADDRALAEGILASLQTEAEASTPAPEKSTTSTNKPASAPKSADRTRSEKQPAPQSKKTSIREEHYQANRALAKRLHGWLDDHGFEIIKNKGGNDATSCLLISLMQHAKGDYNSEHSADVDNLRTGLNEQTRKKQPDHPDSNRYSLYADSWEIKWLVDQIKIGRAHV